MLNSGASQLMLRSWKSPHSCWAMRVCPMASILLRRASGRCSGCLHGVRTQVTSLRGWSLSCPNRQLPTYMTNRCNGSSATHHNCGECKFFIGAIQFKPWERIWKSWASGKCKFFMWLVAHDKCWMADRLARKGLPHPEHCLLCDQEAICYCIAFSHGRSGSVFYKGSVCRL